MSVDKTEGEVISFEKAAEPSTHARSERKLEKVQKTFKAVIRQKLKQDRIEARKKSKNRRKKKVTGIALAINL